MAKKLATGKIEPQLLLSAQFDDSTGIVYGYFMVIIIIIMTDLVQYIYPHREE